MISTSVSTRAFQPVIALVLALAFYPAMSAPGQQKSRACSKPPELIPPPKKPNQGNQPHPKRVRGTVAIEISEDGDVVAAKALQPSSGEVADYLVSLAKSMKFKPRPGCGIFKTEVTYSPD